MPILLALVFAPDLAAQSSTEDRIRASAMRLVINQPDYTCLQTIERFERRRQKGKFRRLDKLRLEVALIDGKEVFAWPGSRRFDIEDLGQVFPHGTASTGSFALHAKSILASGQSEWEAAGTEEVNGVECLKYAYRIPKHKSQYWLQTYEGASIVGKHGFFWVNAENFDLVRIEVNVDDVPTGSLVAAIVESVDYARSRIGAGESVLPVQSTSTVYTTDKVAMRNTMTFSGCRQYVGESTVSFGPVDEALLSAPKPPPQPPKEFTIPAGLMVELVLDTPLRVDKSVVGDQLSAHVRGNVKRGGAVILPKGATATGRITEMQHKPGRSEYHAIAIVFDTVEFDGQRASFSATLLGFQTGFPVGVYVSTSPSIFDGRTSTGLSRRNYPPSPSGVFYARAPSRVFQLPKKTIILYQTR